MQSWCRKTLYIDGLELEHRECASEKCFGKAREREPTNTIAFVRGKRGEVALLLSLPHLDTKWASYSAGYRRTGSGSRRRKAKDAYPLLLNGISIPRIAITIAPLFPRSLLPTTPPFSSLHYCSLPLPPYSGGRVYCLIMLLLIWASPPDSESLISDGAPSGQSSASEPLLGSGAPSYK